MKSVYNFIQNESNIKEGDTIVLGVSGGPDSMVLLSIFNELKVNMKINIICAHVNHNIRKESEEEQVFIEKYCNENNIPFEFMKIMEYGDDNFHNEARTIRYTFFEKIVNKYQAKFLATAHHGDDLIETILMRIARGSSLKGYSGFSKVVNKDKYSIIRPLITVTKDEILKFASENHIEYRIDKSNFKDVYTRNRYRNHVLPFLKSEDENIHLKFLKFSETLIEYNNFISKELKKVINKIVKKNVIDIDELKKVDHLIQIKVIYSFLENVYNDDLLIITETHVNLILDLIKSKKANAVVHLPNNYVCKKSYNFISIEEKKEEKEEYEIEINGIINLPNNMSIDIVKECEWTNNFCTRLSTKEIKLPLYVRTRKDGDKIRIKGMDGRKKVNNIFTNEKISENERNIWPIVCDSNDKIVWLPGLKKSVFDKDKNEEYDIVLRYY